MQLMLYTQQYISMSDAQTVSVSWKNEWTSVDSVLKDLLEIIWASLPARLVFFHYFPRCVIAFPLKFMSSTLSFQKLNHPTAFAGNGELKYHTQFTNVTLIAQQALAENRKIFLFFLSFCYCMEKRVMHVNEKEKSILLRKTVRYTFSKMFTI